MKYYRGKVVGIVIIIFCSYWFYINDFKWCMVLDLVIIFRMVGGDLNVSFYKGLELFG